MGMITEFKEFAMKGNLVDMAVGFVMGGAFATVVTSFINDIFMPPLGKVLGGVDFGNMKYVIQEASMGADGAEVAEVAIRFGAFINAFISFLIVAFVMFMIIKSMNKLKKKEEEAPAAPPANEVLLAEIRDLMAKQVK